MITPTFVLSLTELPSENNSAYCQARNRLPEKLLQQLFGSVAQNLEQKTTLDVLWYGLHVKVVSERLTDYQTTYAQL